MSDILVVNTTGAQAGVTTELSAYSALGFDTVLPSSSVVGANENPEYPFSNCVDFPDNTKYSPNISSGTVEIELSQPDQKEIDFFGMAIHNGGTAGLSGKLDYWNGSAWVKLFDFNGLSDDKPFMNVFDPVTTQKQRITFTFTDNLFVGTIYIGKAVIGMRTPNVGFQPAKFASIDEVETFTTDGNNTIMGRRIDRGYETKGTFSFVEFDYLDQWYITYMNWVLDSKPLFFKWNSFKDEVFFGRQNPDRLTKPAYSTSFHANINFEMTGYA